MQCRGPFKWRFFITIHTRCKIDLTGIRYKCDLQLIFDALQWRHNERDCVSNHQPHDCLFNCLFRRRSKKTSKLCVTGLCAGYSPVTGEFSAQRASNTENVSIWWRHHGNVTLLVSNFCKSDRYKFCTWHDNSTVVACTNICSDLKANTRISYCHDDIIKSKHFPLKWPFVRGIHRSPVNSPHQGQWRGALMFSLICVWLNGWVNSGEAGNLRRYRAHYDVTAMWHDKSAVMACTNICNDLIANTRISYCNNMKFPSILSCKRNCC